jgi:hypothetical protein
MPIAILAPLERPLGPEFGTGEELVVEVVVFELDVLVEFGGREVVVWAGAVKATRSLLSHQTGIPSPKIVYAEVIVVVVAFARTMTLFDKLVVA